MLFIVLIVVFTVTCAAGAAVFSARNANSVLFALRAVFVITAIANVTSYFLIKILHKTYLPAEKSAEYNYARFFAKNSHFCKRVFIDFFIYIIYNKNRTNARVRAVGNNAKKKPKNVKALGSETFFG